MTTPSRTPLELADRLFLLAHNDRTGAPLVGSGALGLGLAGALLGELLLADLIAVPDAVVWVIAGTYPSSHLAHRLLTTMAREPVPLPVRTWLSFLAPSAADEVGKRLHAGGWLHRQQRTGLLGRRVRVEFPNPTAVAYVGVGLRERLRRRVIDTGEDTLLAGLADATGLTGPALWTRDGDSVSYLAGLAMRAPPPLRALIEHTRAAVADAVVTHHG